MWRNHVGGPEVREPHPAVDTLLNEEWMQQPDVERNGRLRHAPLCAEICRIGTRGIFDRTGRNRRPLRDEAGQAQILEQLRTGPPHTAHRSVSPPAIDNECLETLFIKGRHPEIASMKPAAELNERETLLPDAPARVAQRL
jgi:hypothetical protein